MHSHSVFDFPITTVGLILHTVLCVALSSTPQCPVVMLVAGCWWPLLGSPLLHQVLWEMQAGANHGEHLCIHL